MTAWELQRRGIPVTLICDSMAAQVMKERKIQKVIVGADRIAANGDTANKIGTYGVALVARAHCHPLLRGRAVEHVRPFHRRRLADSHRRARSVRGHPRFRPPDRASGIDVYNPAFDVTPAELVTAIITEKGVIQPVNRENIRSFIQG